MYFLKNGIFIKINTLINEIIENIIKNNGIVIAGEVLPKILSGVMCKILYNAFMKTV